MTYKEYKQRWKNDGYRYKVRREARRIKSDGCSGPTLPMYEDGCFEHDIHYAIHKDFYEGVEILQEDADRMMKWYIWTHSWFGRWSPMARWRYRALSKNGANFGEASWVSGPRRLQERLSAG